MMPVLQKSDAVIDKARGTAPYRDVTAFEAQAAYRIRAAFTAPQEYSGQAERDGDDRSPGILFVTILVKAEFGACDVAVDQASVRIVVGKSGLGSGIHGNVEKRARHRGPWRSGVRILGVVAVTGAVGHPADAATVGHGHRHGVTAGCNQVAE